MHLVLRPIQPAIAGRLETTQRTGVHAVADRGKPQGGARERNQTLLGSVCPDDVAWFHGLCLGWEGSCPGRPGIQAGADCKESLRCRQPPARMVSSPVASHTQHVTSITVARRQNALGLFQDYAEKALARGASPKGLEQAFAATLQISPSMWSQIKSSRPIGDKLARQIEAAAGKAAGWLDEERVSAAPSPAELAFLELALAAYRSTNAPGRKALRAQLESLLQRRT